ncbi:MAG TPA: hypothetical protein VFC09_06690 [Candidatus Dormibacteraeota bacterium]|nr:hypothetical protein [Candidatus Dormibacteraeota bacterium]
MDGSDAPRGPRRIGPLGIALVLALVPAAGVAVTVAVKQLTAPRAVVGLPAPTATPRSIAPSPAAPTPPPALFSTVPAGTDVVYWANWDGVAAAPYPLHAVDAAGHDRGTVDLSVTRDASRGAQQPEVLPSPDGHDLLLDTDVYSEDGIWQRSLPAGGQTVWADDSSGICRLSAGANALRVDLDSVTGRPDLSAETSLSGAQGAESASLLACSGTRQAAVVLLTARGPGQTTAALRLDLHAGTATVERVLCTGACAQPAIASPDGEDVAYQDAGHRVAVVDMPTGAVQRLDARGWPAAFSGDGRAVAVSLDAPQSAAVLQRVPGIEVLDWRSGAVEWSRPDAQTLPQWAFALPGAGIAVAACEYAPNTGVFPSGPCRMDIVSAHTTVPAAAGLDFAFSLGPF